MKHNIFKKAITLATAFGLMVNTVPVYAGTFTSDGNATVPINAVVEGGYEISMPASVTGEFKDLVISESNKRVLFYYSTDIVPVVDMNIRKNKAIMIRPSQNFYQFSKDGTPIELYISTDDDTLIRSNRIGNNTEFLDDLYSVDSAGVVRIMKPSAASSAGFDSEVVDALTEFETALTTGVDDNTKVQGSGAAYKFYKPTVSPQKDENRDGVPDTEDGAYIYLENTELGEHGYTYTGSGAHTLEDFMSDYGPGVYSLNYEITWSTTDIPSALLK